MKYKIALIVVAVVGFFGCLGLQIFLFHNIDGLFINLAAAFLQILIAVFLVDYLLRADDRAKWAGFEQRVQQRIISLSNFILLEVRSILGINLDHSAIQGLPSLDSKEVNQLMKNNMLQQKNQFKKLLRQFSRDDWAQFSSGMRQISNEVENTMLLYTPKLSPVQLELLSEIKEEIALIVLFPQAFPDAMDSIRQGIDGKTNNSDDRPEGTQHKAASSKTSKHRQNTMLDQLCESTAEKLDKLVQLSVDLVNSAQ